ncbi:hypothetical protein C2G38_2178360 [Gigaspora rosea]|uniref:Tyr recombinase domain-containing protein n=1 Tax=Gigaspora rosea TaxID=44941 RepID=A0A397VG55_9GLOM|nr:hypothetical protein C2G38_2178360 [Gigaspora rosea]
MIREICHITSIDTDLKKITNHSIRYTAIQILTQLNVSTDYIMAFSGHRSPGDTAIQSPLTSLSNNQDTTTIRSPLASLSSNQDSALSLVTSSLNHQISGPIRQKRIRVARKFTPFYASRPT